MTGITPRYKRLEVEWKHFAVNGATCERCGAIVQARVPILSCF